jgi:succinate dehydrogenase/fumarate reductase flavoprotein subunit
MADPVLAPGEAAGAPKPAPVVADVEVLVLGSGAAGLTAALSAASAGARVGLYEKGDLVGGTTALSSAVAWLPANRYAAHAGVADSREEALAYLASLSHGLIHPELAEAFVDTVPELLDWLDEQTPLRLRLVAGFPDYHPEHPGGKPRGGRSLEPELFSFAEIPGWGERMVGVTRPMLVAETPIGGGSGLLPPDVAAERRAASLEGVGRGMVGALLKGCLDRGIEPVTGARAERLLIRDEAVVGVEFDSRSGRFAVTARAVVLATGGFEHDVDLVRAFLRGPMRLPAGVTTNTGGGLRMAMRVGAELGMMSEAWWVPVLALPQPDPRATHQPVLLVNLERTLPRSIMVNGQGKRFTNEAANYNALGGAFHHLDPTTFSYVNQPAWLLFDQGFVDRFGGFGVPPGGPAQSWLTCAPDLDALAEATGIPAIALSDTVVRWNAQAAALHDDDFARGQSAYDGWSGERRHYPGPAATLGPLDEPPYYAVQIVGSCLGTKGGPRTDADGRVLHLDGGPIPGLYAAGNAMAAPTGMVYGGAGGTLGPALVFGYRAGRSAARQR